MHMSYSQGRVWIVGGPKPSFGYADVIWKRLCDPWEIYNTNHIENGPL